MLTWGVESTQAQPTVVFTGNNATGIQDLQIGSEFFNVEFVFDFGPDIYGIPPIFRFPVELAADVANLAVNAVLTSESAVETVGGNNSTTYVIAFEFENGFYTLQGSYYNFILNFWERFETPDLLPQLNPTTFAVFTATCPADISDDGNVDVTDLLDLLASWGTCGAPCPADTNNDGDVNVTDLLDLLAEWGPC